MGRSKKIPTSVDTEFFRNVTPLWVGPRSKPIDQKYHSSVQSLVQWIGPNWPTNNESNFFLMRDLLIKSCEKWRLHDWDADEAWIDERRADERNRPTLAKAFSNFQKVLKLAPFKRKKKMLGLAFLVELCPDLPTRLSNAEGVAGVERAIERFAKNVNLPDSAYAKYGCIEYKGIPVSIPRKEVALALSLADQITFWRRDGMQVGTMFCPHKPSLSKNLPWKAIAEFASANCADANQMLDSTNVQTLVTSLRRNVALIYW